jgi:propionyl-CoA carboxylase beta chain
VGITHRRAIEGAADPAAEHARLADEYAEGHLRAEVAAGAGDVDEVIEPAETRARLIWALSALDGANGRRRTA